MFYGMVLRIQAASDNQQQGEILNFMFHTYETWMTREPALKQVSFWKTSKRKHYVQTKGIYGSGSVWKPFHLMAYSMLLS